MEDGASLWYAFTPLNQLKALITAGWTVSWYCTDSITCWTGTRTRDILRLVWTKCPVWITSSNDCYCQVHTIERNCPCQRTKIHRSKTWLITATNPHVKRWILYCFSYILDQRKVKWLQREAKSVNKTEPCVLCNVMNSWHIARYLNMSPLTI